MAAGRDGWVDTSELDALIPVTFGNGNLTPSAVDVRLVFAATPLPEDWQSLWDIAVAWGTIGLRGGFGGRLKVFSDEPEFELIELPDGTVLAETVLDLGTAPLSSLDVLFRAVRSHAIDYGMPLACIEVGQERHG